MGRLQLFSFFVLHSLSWHEQSWDGYKDRAPLDSHLWIVDVLKELSLKLSPHSSEEYHVSD
jgi:hypothetical protein